MTKKKTFIRKSLNYLPFIIMIAKCQTPGHNIKGGIEVVKYMLGRISQARKNDLEDRINELIQSIETVEAKKVISETTKLEC